MLRRRILNRRNVTGVRGDRSARRSNVRLDGPYSSMCVGREWEFALCQNCVTYPPKPPVNIVTYERIAEYFVVAGTD